METNLFDFISEALQYMWRVSGKYTQKPRAEQIYLLCRGAAVYVAARPNCGEAGSNANLSARPNAEGNYMNIKAFWSGAGKIAAAGLLYC